MLQKETIHLVHTTCSGLSGGLNPHQFTSDSILTSHPSLGTLSLCQPVAFLAFSNHPLVCRTTHQVYLLLNFPRTLLSSWPYGSISISPCIFRTTELLLLTGRLLLENFVTKGDNLPRTISALSISASPSSSYRANYCFILT